ncbi:MAG: hypothetical protein U0174_26670 [Polyangiaceae bacterium]
MPPSSPPIGPKAVVLLGEQRFDPSLGASVSKLRVGGKIAVITAGWQEREAEDKDLADHLGGRTINLNLHARADDIFRKDKEFHSAHRERQEVLRHRQDCYRIRLEHALEAERVIRQRNAPRSILEEETDVSIESIRELDAQHLVQCGRIHRDFNERMRTASRPSVAKHRKEIAEIVADCDAIAIAGGHVATLVNRLALFGIASLTRGRIVFAWSGGAMAISERVVLFHDDPPQGPGAAEVLDEGAGLVRGVVVLPQPEQRLKLEQKDRVRIMARRFAPSICLALPARSRVTWRQGKFSSPDNVQELRPDGEHGKFEPKKAEAS